MFFTVSKQRQNHCPEVNRPSKRYVIETDDDRVALGFLFCTNNLQHKHGTAVGF